jgi:hypothetical protein
MDDYQNKIENQFSQLEKTEQSKGFPILYGETVETLTSLRKTQG